MNQLTPTEKEAILTFYPPNNLYAEPNFTSRDEFPLFPEKPILKLLHHLTSNEILMACRAYYSVPFSMVTHTNVTIMPIDNTTQLRVVIDDCNYTYRFDYSNGGIAVYKNGDHIWPTESQNYLTQHYRNKRIAIRHYFDQGHWANGKTAIDLGLAVPNRDSLVNILMKEYNNDKELVKNWFYEKEIMYNVNLFDPKILDEKIAELKSAAIGS